MAKDDKKAEAGTTPKSDAGAKNTSSPAEGSPKAESSETGNAPSGYSRGDGQKAVTRAYKENWNAIFANKRAKKSAKKKKR